MRIAYVEDNPTNLALVERVCGMNHHTVVSYSEGEIALQQLVREKFDLILMDVELAGEISGLQVVRHLRRVGLKTPIVAVTAYAMMGDRERCLEAGCNDYLPKPLPINDLLVMLAKYDAITAAGPQPVAEPAKAAVPVVEQPAPAAASKVEPPGVPTPPAPPVPSVPVPAPVPQTTEQKAESVPAGAPVSAQPAAAPAEMPAKPAPPVPPVPEPSPAVVSAAPPPTVPKPGADAPAEPVPAALPAAASAEAPPAAPKPNPDTPAEPVPAVSPGADKVEASPAAPKLNADAPAKSDEVAPLKHTS